MTPIAVECREAVLFARGGDIGRSLDLARNAYHRAQANGPPSDLLRALNAVALCQLVSGAYIEAMATAMDAHRLASRLSDPRAMLQALTTIATASAFILETSSILRGTLDRCLAEAQSLGDATLELQVRNARGVIRLKRQDFDVSITEFSHAADLLARADGSMPASIIAANIAGVRVRKAGAAEAGARPLLQQEAEAAIRGVLDLPAQTGNQEAISRAHFSLAILFQQRGKHRLALDALNDSYALADALKHRYRKTATHLERGRIYIAMEACELALDAFEAAHAEAEASRPCKELSTASDYLAQVYESMNNRRAAADSRARAESEREEFNLECMAAWRDLSHFWREVSADPQELENKHAEAPIV